MKVKTSILQLLTGEDKGHNIQNAKQYIQKALAYKPDIVILPEVWNSPYSTDAFPKYAEDIQNCKSESVDMLRQAAIDNKCIIVGGSIPELRDGKIYNTCCIFDSEGQMIGKYSKTHLFDIDIPGKISFQESKTLTKGEDLTLINTKFGKIGILLCYDIRFPELSQLYAQRGAQILIMPGSFNTTTGPAHWQLLHQARAVDNQLYFVGCSPARNPQSQYLSYGHSMAVGPFAEIIGQLDENQGILNVELDLSQVESRRTNMPLQKQRRIDLYDIIDKKK